MEERIKFYDFNSIANEKLKYAILFVRYHNTWVFVRNKKRDTWETPAGHREYNENILITAERELVEETGALDFKILPLYAYSVEDAEGESFGGLFYGEIYKIGSLPDYEIGELSFMHNLPEKLTYPEIQRVLFEKVKEHIKGMLIKKHCLMQG
ncbi:NUDIX hydrolase [Clostridium polynesiense]|uniref:NUDIX hydrolase n=1 Tax=Clostridium polynesiense TaxID=1325933 RepID=UPI0005907C20|nr:NUDIX domain-containing protein [Clostridium polynesiense]